MRNTWLLACFLMLCSALHAQDKSTLKTDSLRILMLGDSYTAGRLIPPDQTFAALLLKKLSSKHLAAANPLLIAQEGWRTDELLKGITNAKLPYRFDVVTMLIGVNNQFQHKDTAVYRAEFKQLLDSCISLTAGSPKRVIVLSIPDWGVTPFAVTRNSERITAEINTYNDINKQLSKKAGVVYIDITRLSRDVADDAETLAADKLHPSGKMYGWWADKVVAAIKAMQK